MIQKNMKRNDDLRTKLKTLKINKSSSNLITISNKLKQGELSLNMINMLSMPVPSRFQSGEIKPVIAIDRR
jgi:hypothetical protein